MSNIVYTYFHDVPQIAANEQGKLIAHWVNSWKRNGWIPVILGIEHAKRHPKFAEFDRLVRSFPSQNPPEYELACWYRWLALDQVDGGVMTDYDVMNRSFKPADRPLSHVELLHPHSVPCAVEASKVGAIELVDSIIHGQHVIPEKHYSDMLWFQRQTLIRRVDQLREFGEFEWEQANLVHFSHHACATRGKPSTRFELVREHFPIR